MEFQTLKELYTHSIKAYGNRPSFSMLERESMTYNDFDDREENVRGILLGAGIGSATLSPLAMTGKGRRQSEY